MNSSNLIAKRARARRAKLLKIVYRPVEQLKLNPAARCPNRTRQVFETDACVAWNPRNPPLP